MKSELIKATPELLPATDNDRDIVLKKLGMIDARHTVDFQVFSMRDISLMAMLRTIVGEMNGGELFVPDTCLLNCNYNADVEIHHDPLRHGLVLKVRK